jgi:hypothetical protein
MRKALLFLFLTITVSAMAQRKNRHTPILQKELYLSFNPHALLEPHQGAAGLGMGYRLNKRIEFFTEISYLYRGIDGKSANDFNNLKGFRGIVSGKYFYQNKYGFFVGADIRIKQYSFNGKNTFVNSQLRDTLNNYQYKPQHTLIGIAAFWGKCFKITANGKFELEGNIGIGVKRRFINRKNVPTGYLKLEYLDQRRISPIPDDDIEQDLPYFPATFRFIYHL